MNRFASLERFLTYSLTASEYRHLLQTDSPFDYIEHEELSLLPYQELQFVIKLLSPMEKLQKASKKKLTHAQLEQVKALFRNFIAVLISLVHVDSSTTSRT